MSFGRVAAALKIKGLAKAEQIVLVRLADHESKTGLCYPSVRGLREESGLSTCTIQYAIGSLCEKKIIYTGPYVDKWGNKRTRFYFNFEKVKEDSGDGDEDDDGCGIDYHTGCIIQCHTGVSPTDTPRVSPTTTPGVSLSDTKPITITDNSKPINKPPPPTVSTVPTVGSDSNNARSRETASTVGGGGDVDDESASNGQGAPQPDPQPSPRIDPAVDPHRPAPKRRLVTKPGFTWLNDFEPYTDPFAKLFADKGCCFIPAYDSLLGIEGNTLTQAAVVAIFSAPVSAALSLIRETDNRITRQALESRLRWIGRDYFAGEVVRLRSEVENRTIKCRHLGRTLLRRLDYCFAYKIATVNFTRQYDVKRLWDFALGIIKDAA